MYFSLFAAITFHCDVCMSVSTGFFVSLTYIKDNNCIKNIPRKLRVLSAHSDWLAGIHL